jgi:hypothetical protein
MRIRLADISPSKIQANSPISDRQKLVFWAEGSRLRNRSSSKRSDVFSSHNAKVKEDTGYVNPAKSNKREWPRNHCPLMPSSKVTFFAVER